MHTDYMERYGKKSQRLPVHDDEFIIVFRCKSEIVLVACRRKKRHEILPLVFGRAKVHGFLSVCVCFVGRSYYTDNYICIFAAQNE